ncbi:hypothetical protein BGW80DRAFT_1278529, partial [Lactifluus volemus]
LSSVRRSVGKCSLSHLYVIFACALQRVRAVQIYIPSAPCFRNLPSSLGRQGSFSSSSHKINLPHKAKAWIVTT